MELKFYFNGNIIWSKFLVNSLLFCSCSKKDYIYENVQLLTFWLIFMPWIWFSQFYRNLYVTHFLWEHNSRRNSHSILKLILLQINADKIFIVHCSISKLNIFETHKVWLQLMKVALCIYLWPGRSRFYIGMPIFVKVKYKIFLLIFLLCKFSINNLYILLY